MAKKENPMRSSRRAFTAERQVMLLFIVMVVVGYIIAFIRRPGMGLPPLTSVELILGIALGIVYLLVGLNENQFYQRIVSGWAAVSFFSVECGLILGIGLLLGVGGSWLMAIPLVGYAVERLAPRGRWAVYIAVVVCSVLPIGLRQGYWISTLINSATVGTAVAFVALFAHLRLNEQQAREGAEQLMLDLEQANVRLAAYATQAEELAVTQERNRLAREIHDNLGHTLTIVNVQIEAAKAVMESDSKRALDALDKAQRLAREGLTGVRRSVAALRESPVSNRSLDTAIAELVHDAQSSGIITEFKVVGEPAALGHKAALALYRAAQEGLTNVRRHARASRVDVTITYQSDELCLEVVDNGVGSAEMHEGFGLLGIRERMRLLGGSVDIRTGVGEGFYLRSKIPMSAAGEPP